MQNPGHRLIQLVYVSRPCPFLDLEDVHDILQVAQRRNNESGITGILSFGRNYFLQALEGPELTVMECLGAIREDPRHTDMRVIYSDPITQRLFPTWSMAYVPKPLLFEILRSSGIVLNWHEAEDSIRSWDEKHAISALTSISQEPRANLSPHNTMLFSVRLDH